MNVITGTTTGPAKHGFVKKSSKTGELYIEPINSRYNEIIEKNKLVGCKACIDETTGSLIVEIVKRYEFLPEPIEA